jgi:hypothetical protein
MSEDKGAVVKQRTTPYFRLVLEGEEGVPAREWKLCYDYRAIGKIEEATGLDLKKFESWKEISSGKHFPHIVWGGLNRYNPEVTLDEVIDVLNPEAQRLLSDAIFELMFPGVREAVLKQMEAERTGATASPNVPTETPRTTV